MKKNIDRLYRIYDGMKTRCRNKNHVRYKNYGGAGITICDEWSRYSGFKDWALKNGYSDNLTLDRIDRTKGYSPSNCRWVSPAENNRTSGKAKLDFAKADEIRKMYVPGMITHRQISKIFGVSEKAVFDVLNNNSWSDWKY